MTYVPGYDVIYFFGGLTASSGYFRYFTKGRGYLGNLFAIIGGILIFLGYKEEIE